MTNDLRRLLRWMAGRTWSRAGAISSVLTTGAPRRVLVLSTRIALLVSGSLVVAFAVSLMLWNEFGPGPLDVFIVGLRTTLGIPFAFAVWVAFGLLAALAWALGRRPGLGTIAAPLIIGPTVQSVLAMLESIDPPSTIAGRLVVQVLAVAIAGIGSGALIVAGLGAGTGELLATAASDRTGQGESPMRFAFEVSWLVVGVALGGPIGPGTIVVAVLIGPAVAIGHRVVDHSVTSSRRHLFATVPRRAEPRQLVDAGVTSSR